jgi:RNA polymerase sigma-70 factor (ECF subfamily)
MNRQHTAHSEGDTLQAGVLDLNERNWLPRHCRGDEQAFEELLRAYRNLVFTFLYRYGVESHHRDDLFQDIFLKIHQSAASYRPSEPLRPWVISIVLNTVRNFRRDRGRRKHFMAHFKALSGNIPTGNHHSGSLDRQKLEAGLDEQVEQQSTVIWLEQQITMLPERQREVLVLSTLKGLRMKDISKVMALPENTVKTHLRRARMALAESLARREINRGDQKVDSREESNEQL